MAIPTKPSQERSRRRREELLRATVAVMAEHGSKGVTHRAVAEFANLPVASTTYYFSSREEMIEQALRLHVAERVAEMNALTESVRSSGDLDAKFVDQLLATLVDRPEEAVLSLFEFYLEASRTPAMRAPVEEALAAFEGLAAATLAGVGVREPQSSAEAVIAIIDGFALHRMARSRDRADDISGLYNALRAHLVASVMDEEELRKRFADLTARD